jgi:pimeloyl-ACP methyl ester carboxylesterase
LGGAGRPLVLAHANGMHGRAYAPLAEHLSRCRILAPDFRGHGDTLVANGLDYDWEGFGDDIAAVVDGLDLGSALLGFGHSMGGAALLMVEQRRPGTFEALYLFEPIVFPPGGPSLPDDENPMVAGALRRKQEFPSYEDALANFSEKAPLAGLDPSALRAYVEHGFAPGPDGAVHIKCAGEVEAQIYRMGPHHRTFDRLGDVACAVTVACGRADEPGPANYAPLVVEQLACGNLERFDHLGHFGPLEDPHAVGEAVRISLGL